MESVGSCSCLFLGLIRLNTKIHLEVFPSGKSQAGHDNSQKQSDRSERGQKEANREVVHDSRKGDWGERLDSELLVVAIAVYPPTTPLNPPWPITPEPSGYVRCPLQKTRCAGPTGLVRTPPWR